MVKFSISAVVDGGIHLGAFLLVCAGIYLFLKITARERFESHILRTVIVVSAFIIARIYLDQGVVGSLNLVIQLAVILAIMMVVIFVILKPDPVIGLLSAIVLVALGTGGERLALTISARITPEGPTFAEFIGLANDAMEEHRKMERPASDEKDINLADVMRKGLDALASLTQEEELDAMKTDFSRGMGLFAERKEWMDSLTPEEKQAYRAEMSAFLAEQGLAEDRYSLAAIKDTNPTNLLALADLFSDLQDETVEEEERIRSIPESLAQLTANFSGFELDEGDQEVLRGFAELFGKGEIEEAVEKARKDLESVKGDDELMGTVLAAILQTQIDLPLDQMLSQGEGTAVSFQASGLPDDKVESSYIMTDENMVSVIEEPIPQAEITEVTVTESTETRPVDPFIRITTRYGVVLLPNEEEDLQSWIATAHEMEMKGFLSLGDEVIILRHDGEMVKKGERWSVIRNGYLYHFRVDTIMKNRVAMRADSRESINGP